MTTFARPEDYEALEELPPADPQLAVLNRIAVAVEQIALELANRPQGNGLAQLPPVRPQPVAAPAQFGVCPVHHVPWKTVPAGISKKSGKPYEAFLACPERGCDQRPG